MNESRTAVHERIYRGSYIVSRNPVNKRRALGISARFAIYRGGVAWRFLLVLLFFFAAINERINAVTQRTRSTGGDR